MTLVELAFPCSLYVVSLALHEAYAFFATRQGTAERLQNVAMKTHLGAVS